MKNSELITKIEEAFEKYSDEFEYVGLRFEDKARVIGEVCENSRHNPDREDGRDFPAFGSEEYDDLEEMEGTSAYQVDGSQYYKRSFMGYFDSLGDKVSVTADHCHIIVGDEIGAHDQPDVNEILIIDAEVKAILF